MKSRYQQWCRTKGLEAAATVLDRDWDRMLTFYQFPRAHWGHLRTTNPIESPFAALRLRTDAASRFEKVDNATAVNLGTTERTRVIDAVREVTRLANYSPRIEFLPHMPTGPLNRVAGNDLAKRVLGWEPEVAFMEGLAQTFDWYTTTHNPKEVRTLLERRLTER